MANSSWFNTSNQYIKYRIEVTQNSQNVANNTSNVTVKVWIYRTNTGYTTYGSGTCYCKINGTTYSASITSSQKITNSGIYLFSKTLDIGHNSDGSKSLTCSAWFSHDRFSSNEQSASFGLTTIPRKSTISSITGGTMGGSMTVNINRASSSFTTDVWVQLGKSDWIGVVSRSTATAITFTVPTSLANQIPNATGGTGQVIIRTYDANGNNLGDYISIKDFLVPDYSPTINSWAYSEEGTGLGIYIQGKSKVKCSCSCGTSYGASITSYTWNINGTNYSGASATTGYINGSGNKTLTLTIKDSRGKTATRSATINFIAYSPPVAKISAYRCDDNGNYDTNSTKVKATITGSVSSVSGKNTIAIEVRAKDTSTSNWGDPVTFSSAQTDKVLTLNNYDTNKTYTLQIKVTDKWTTSIASVEIPTAFVTMDFKSGGNGVALGKVADIEGILDIGFPTFFRGHLRHRGFVTSTSSDTHSDGTYMTKFARVDVSSYNYKTCMGILRILSQESNLVNGDLRYYFRYMPNGSTQISLRWMTCDGLLMENSIRCVKVANGIFDLFYVPKSNWITIKGIQLEGFGEDYMTFYNEQPYVLVSSAQAEVTSGFTATGSSNVPGAWWNGGAVNVKGDGVCEVGKYLDFHVSHTSTADHDGRMYCNGSDFFFTKSLVPDNNNTFQLGTTSNRWSWINLVNSPNVSSDRTLKENIQYLRNNNVSKDDAMTYSDMYNFVRDDLELAKYNFKGQDTEEINFIAQDLLYNLDGTNNKVGQFIVNPVAPNTEEEIEAIKENLEEGQEYHDPTLSYDMGNYVSVLAGALKSAINEIEILKQEVISLKQIIDMNKY